MNNLLRSFRKHRPDVIALSARLDGVLDPRESARLDAHLASCDACSTQLDGLRAIRATLRSMPEATAPRSFRLRVADTVPVAAPRSPMLRWAPAAGAFAGVVIAVVVGASLYSGGSSNSSQETAKAQRGSPQMGSALAPTVAAGAASDADTSTAPDATGPGAIAPDASEAPPSTGELASPEVAAAIPESTAEGGADFTTTRDYDSAANGFASDAARAVATAAVQIQAAAAAAPEDDGNNSTAFVVIEIIAATAALIAAAIVIRWWRRRGEEA